MKKLLIAGVLALVFLAGLGTYKYFGPLGTIDVSVNSVGVWAYRYWLEWSFDHPPAQPQEPLPDLDYEYVKPNRRPKRVTPARDRSDPETERSLAKKLYCI